MNQGNSKNTYYAKFNTTMFLGAKELLKSMPTFYNRVYFSTVHANALWSGDKDEEFNNIIILADLKELNSLRQIIKNNFLYIQNWDSKTYFDDGEYGFSFIAGNVKYILMAFSENEEGYTIYSFNTEAKTGMTTSIKTDKKFFKDTSIKENGEIVRTCDFKVSMMNEENTKVSKATKNTQPDLIVYENKGYALANTILFVLIATLASGAIFLAYSLIAG